MPSFLSSSNLIATVKRKENIPTSQVTFQDTDFLAFANDEMSCAILPTVLQFHEEFLVYTSEIPLLPNVFSYAIPGRAVGNKVRAIMYKDTNGTLYEMTRINPDFLPNFSLSGEASRAFYFQNNNIVLLQNWLSSQTGSIVISYYMRPNQLVTEDRIGYVAAIDFVAGNITLSATPPTVFNAGLKFDFMELAGGHKTRAWDKVSNTVNTATNVVNFNPSDIPSDLQVGDYLALAGECIIPQIPDELHNVLAQRVAARCLEALGDMQGLNAANVKLQEIEGKIGNLIDNRSDGNLQKVVNPNGLLRRGKGRRLF